MGLLKMVGLRRSNQFERLTLIDHMLLSPLTFIFTLLYRILLFLRGAPFTPPRNKEPVKVVCISDTHDNTVQVPEGDILVHAGDLTNDGTAADIQKQLDWLKTLPHGVKIVVAGNHDSYFDAGSRCDDDIRTKAKLDFGDIHYLEGSQTVADVHGRKISIFGAPYIPECGPRSFA